jgi:hypothetical protein
MFSLKFYTEVKKEEGYAYTRCYVSGELYMGYARLHGPGMRSWMQLLTSLGSFRVSTSMPSIAEVAEAGG